MREIRFHMFLISIMALVILPVLACATKAIPELEAKVAPATQNSLQSELWETKWQTLINLARKEGKVYIRSSYNPETRQALQEAFKKNFGIELEMETGKSAETIAKTLAERNAGLFIPDIHIGGPTDMVQILKPKNVLESLDGIVFLPEVIDEKLWERYYGPYFDKDHMLAGSTSSISPPILVNSKLVNPQEIKSYMDLLNPKWKGKILMGDPTVSGGQQSTAVAMWLIMGEDYFIKLFKQQEIVFTRDKVQLVDWVAKEKYSIAIGAVAKVIVGYLEAGAPLKAITPVEGGKESGAGVFALMKQAPHPNAGRLFMNWMLTREAQIIFSRNSGDASRRLDVSNEWIDPAFIRQPGVMYIEDDEDFALTKSKISEMFIPYVK